MMDVDYVGGRRSCDSAVTWDKQEPCAVAVLLERLMGQHGAMSEGTLVLRLPFLYGPKLEVHAVWLTRSYIWCFR